MFGIGPLELVVILVVALLVFGPKRVPELARTIGRGLAEFRRASNDLRQTLALDELQRDLQRDLDNKQTIHKPEDRPAQAGDDLDPKAQSSAEAAGESRSQPTKTDVSPEPAPSDDDSNDSNDAQDAQDADDSGDSGHRDAGAPDDADSNPETHSNSPADGELGNIPVSGSDPKRG